MSFESGDREDEVDVRLHRISTNLCEEMQTVGEDWALVCLPDGRLDFLQRMVGLTNRLMCLLKKERRKGSLRWSALMSEIAQLPEEASRIRAGRVQ